MLSNTEMLIYALNICSTDIIYETPKKSNVLAVRRLNHLQHDKRAGIKCISQDKKNYRFLYCLDNVG